MARHDYVRYLTETLVRYIDMPREERSQRRRTKVREPWSRYLFGNIPSAWLLFWQDREFRLPRRRSKHNKTR